MNERIDKLICEQLGVEDFTDESTFEELGADSLDLVGLTMALEDEFDIEVPDNLAGDVHTVGDMRQLLADRLDGG